MKKKVILSIMIVCAMIVVLSNAILWGMYMRVTPFSVDEYEEFIELFPQTQTTAPIESARDARNAAKRIFRDAYTPFCNESHQPYIVSFDPVAEVWMVKGNTIFLHEGGVPYVLIRRNGDVMALWHGR